MTSSIIASEPPTTLSPPTRRPYNGSCHCGHIKYIAYLSFPSDTFKPANKPADTSAIYKCNCSTCRKMSIFHIRPINPPSDFQLLSPLNPMEKEGGLGDYLCFAKNAHWLFCANCGVRCFSWAGEGEVRTEDVDGEKKEVWGFKEKEWKENKSAYLSINAVTLEPGQEGLNLREWAENGWVKYAEYGGWNDAQMGRPHVGGMY